MFTSALKHQKDAQQVVNHGHPQHVGMRLAGGGPAKERAGRAADGGASAEGPLLFLRQVRGPGHHCRAAGETRGVRDRGRGREGQERTEFRHLS